MAGIKYNHNMFTVGMISQKIQGNTESESYNNSLLDCKNFYIRQTGGVFKRPGTIFVDDIEQSLRMKLYPYNFPDDNSIVIGIIAGEIFAYNLDGEITSCEAGSLTHDVINQSNFHVLQNANSLYVFSSAGIFEINFDPSSKKLTFNTKDFTFSPVSRVNDNKTFTATFSKSTNTVTLSGDIKFKSSDVGQRCLLFYPTNSGTQDASKISNYSYFKIESITNETTVAVSWEKEYSSYEKVDDIPETATSHFSVPAFGADRGWPIAAGILSNRLYLADEDLMVYGSCIRFDDIFDFTLGADENSAISYRMNNDVGKINWIVGQDKLFVGSPTGIYISGGSGVYEDEKLTPYNISLKKFSSVHASNLPPTYINANIIFTDALSKNVYEISVDESTGTYKTFDLSLLSNELLNSGVVSQTWSSYPVKTYWAVCQNGKLVSMTYEKSNNVMAWSYQELGGQNTAAESVACIQVNGYDYVFVVVRRNVSGENVRSVEYVDRLFEPIDGKEYEQHYVDSGLIRKYEYNLENITQYIPPQISGLTDKDYDSILQNENSNVQYIEMCLLAKDSPRAKLDLYSDNVWKVYENQGVYTNYVSFCHLEKVTKTESRDRIERKYYIKRPLNNHEFEDLVKTTQDAESKVQLGVYKTQLQNVTHMEGAGYAYYFDISTVEVGDKVIFRNSGLKSANGESLDSTEDKYILFEVKQKEPRLYTGCALLDCGKEIDITTLQKGEGKIYRISPTEYTLTQGKNAIARQKLDLTSAVALAELPKSSDRPSIGICAGVLWDGEKYHFAQGRKIYNVLPDFSQWLEEREATSNICTLLDTNTYSTSAIYVKNGTNIPLQGTYQKYIGDIDGLSYFLVSGQVVAVTDGQYYKDESRENLSVGVVYNDKVQVFGPNGEFVSWTKDGEIEGTAGKLQSETRTVRAGIVFKEKVYIVGDAGLIYSRPVGEETTWTYIDSVHLSDWHGVLEYQDKLFLWSPYGEILLLNPSDNSSEYQTISIASNVNGGFIANGTIFLALEDGSVLRSVSNSDYTLTFFDLSSIYIDDVVGMDGINGNKYFIKNIDTSNITSGYVEYELWETLNNGLGATELPADTRNMGVYDNTVSNNGVVHLYFNKVVGLGHLADQSVTICLDGNFLKETTVSPSGAIFFDENIFGMEAHIGYKYTGVLDLMPLSGGNMRGSSVGSVGSQKSAFARLYYSLGGLYGTEEDNMFKIIYPTSLLKGQYNTTKKLYTGVIELPIVNPKDIRERKFRMEHSEPVSFNVLSVAQDAEISDA